MAILEEHLTEQLENVLSSGSDFVFLYKAISTIITATIFSAFDPTESSFKVPFDSIDVFLTFIRSKANIPNVSYYTPNTIFLRRENDFLSKKLALP